MQKLFSILFAMFILILSNQSVEARDVYIGTSDATGWKCYVMTESIHVNQRDDYGTMKSFEATLKMVTNSDTVQYLDYDFWSKYSEGYGDIVWYFKNSHGFRGHVDSIDTPIEYNLCRYILDNY